MEPVMRRLLTLLRRFRSDRRGNIAIMFGLAVVPVFGMMGAALDYSMANMQRTAIQAALDNTAITLSKMMPLSDSDLSSYGWKIFNANLGTSPLQYIQPNLSITQSSNGKLVLQINTAYPMKMASIMTKFFGMSPSMAVDAHSEVQWGNTRLRVALVLDNSGSMSSAGKITALKTATKNLITTLSAVAKNPEDVYISVIPFSKDVAVDSSNYSRDWVYWDNAAKTDVKSWDALNGTCSISGKTPRNTCQTSGKCSDTSYTTQSSCASSGGNCSVSGHDSPSSCATAGTCSISGQTSQSNCTNAGVCSKSSKTTKSTCQSASGTWTTGVWTAATWSGATWTVGVWTPKNHNTWNGCLMDRGIISVTSTTSPGTAADNDQTTVSPSINNETTLFPAEQYSYCTQEMQGLTNNWSTLNTIVDNMQPNGSTNQPLGLVWGWQSLVGGGPLATFPMDTANYAYSQIIILLSDGLNTQNHWDGNGSDTSTAVDNRMYYKPSGITASGTCQNIKNANIQIYTVQVNTGGDPTSAVLQNCASDLSKFFMLTSASAIVTTFDQIGSALANIHLSK
jgi:Flp pilus assembly protein TadG